MDSKISFINSVPFRLDVDNHLVSLIMKLHFNLDESISVMDILFL